MEDLSQDITGVMKNIKTSPYTPYIVDLAKQEGIPPSFAVAVFGTESDLKANAPTSSADAVGIGQVTDYDKKSKEYFPDGGLDPDPVKSNIQVSMRELKQAWKDSGGDPRLAYAQYNGGPKGLAYAKRTGKYFDETSNAISNRLDPYMTAATSVVGGDMTNTSATPIDQSVGAASGMQKSILDNLNASNNTITKMMDIATQRYNLRMQKENDPQTKSDNEATAKSIKEMQDTYSKAIDQAKAGVTQYERSLKPFDPPKPDPFSGFGSLGMTFALVAAKFTKQPVTNSIAAMNGFMQATQKRETNEMKRYTDEWKMNNDLAKARFEAENESMKTVLGYAAKQPELARALAQVHAAKYDDQDAALAAEEGDLGKIGALQES